MYKIIAKKQYDGYTLVEVYAPLVAKSARCGSYAIVRMEENSERLPVSIAYADKNLGMVGFFVSDESEGLDVSSIKVGESLQTLNGAVGNCFEDFSLDAVIVSDGNGLNTALSCADGFVSHGKKVDVIVDKKISFAKDVFGKVDCFKAVDDLATACGDVNFKNRTAIVVGNIDTMKSVSEVLLSKGVKTYVCFNSLILDGIGICGGCRQKIGGKTVFACLSGPFFLAKDVDFGYATCMYKAKKRSRDCKAVTGERND